MYSRLFEQVYMRTHLYEMAALGTIEGPKNKRLMIFTFTREFEFETPHINIGPNGYTAWMKIEIPPTQPETTSDFEIIDWDKRHLVPNSKLKRAILNWYGEIDGKETNYERALNLWKKAIKVHRDMKTRR